MPVKADLKQMFVLIEGILPFEACLYYQVLPLSIEGSSLNLGMVNLSDQAAADYVRRLVSYINCSIVPRQIPSDWHREILSKFLSHSAKNRAHPSASSASPSAPSPSARKAVPPAASPAVSPPTPAARPDTPISSSSISTPDEISTPAATPDATSTPRVSVGQSFAEQPTFVVNAPDTLPPEPASPTTSRTVPSPSTTASPAPSLFNPSVSPPPVSPPAPASTPPPIARSTEPTHAAQPKPALTAARSPSPPPPSPPPSLGAPSAADALPSLQHLPPKALTEALLDRVVDEGIGRLYLERQLQVGRILWSKDGVLQSVLEQIDLQVFQEVLNELKLMVNLSLIPTRKPRQVEIERLHREQPILLRFRLIPGTHGEEATLQVLRGAALKFYQQQQIEKMGRDALGMAHTLQQRLTDIRQQARQNLPTEPVPNETLPAIVEILKTMEQQVNDMMHPPEG